MQVSQNRSNSVGRLIEIVRATTQDSAPLNRPRDVWPTTTASAMRPPRRTPVDIARGTTESVTAFPKADQASLQRWTMFKAPPRAGWRYARILRLGWLERNDARSRPKPGPTRSGDLPHILLDREGLTQHQFTIRISKSSVSTIPRLPCPIIRVIHPNILR